VTDPVLVGGSIVDLAGVSRAKYVPASPMGAVLGEWVGRGDWSEGDGIRVVDLIAAENARRVYGLPLH
jgi:hypothetical protein